MRVLRSTPDMYEREQTKECAGGYDIAFMRCVHVIAMVNGALPL